MFEHLLAPLPLGTKTAANRIVFAAHQTNFAESNIFGRRHLSYYAARARGGVGVIVLEASLVHPSDFPYEMAIFGYDERIVGAYRRLAESVQRHGTLVFAQLTHTGQEGARGLSRRELWAPSPVPNVATLEVPKMMELEDIREVVQGFATAARHAVHGGLDGVELNAGDRSLVRQFLSPLTNHRDDEYGGTLENRLRFAREVIAAVRDELGSGLVLGLRLCGDELAPWAGLTPEAARDVAVTLADTGAVDYLAIAAGSIYSSHMARASMHVPEGYAVPLAEGVKGAVRQPVLATERIGNAFLAEEILATGRANAVEMTRALIADPDLATKVRTAQVLDVRPCVACNQDCVVDSPMNPALACAVNPVAGREGDSVSRQIERSTRHKRIMVVGGGPAGLEAARCAALRGHGVDLYESDGSLGGQIGLASRGPGRGELGKIVEYLEHQVKEAGVRVRLRQTVTVEQVRAEGPDAVVIATGAMAAPPPFPISGEAQVVDDVQVLLGQSIVGKRVVVVDQVGNAAAASVAECLADRGHEVTIVCEDLFASPQLTATQDLILWYQRAAAKGIKLLAQVRVHRIEGNTVVLADRFTHEERALIDTDAVVLCLHRLPEQSLYQALKADGIDVRRAGDCVAPRQVGHAIREGNAIGRAL